MSARHEDVKKGGRVGAGEQERNRCLKPIMNAASTHDHSLERCLDLIGGHVSGELLAHCNNIGSFQGVSFHRAHAAHGARSEGEDVHGERGVRGDGGRGGGWQVAKVVADAIADTWNGMK